MRSESVPTVVLVPVDLISVINPRVRNKKTFNEIIANIADVGLKRPITVALRDRPDGKRYDLVCGQGRLEAFQALGQREIPAIVVEADDENCLVMSLVENIARRQHRSIDLLHDIQGMKQRGYDNPEIARKTGLTLEYVRGIIRLLETGEQRLLRAVECGDMPVSVAVEIAESDDADIQRVLQQAYEGKLLRGRRLMIAKSLIETRRRRGKGFKSGSRKPTQSLSSTALLRAYKENTDKKRMLVRKAEATRNRLLFVTEALRTIFIDENFLTLLRAEDLDTLPRNLSNRLEASARA